MNKIFIKLKNKLQNIDKTSKNYGHDKILKEYLDLPSWFPLDVTIQHGWYPKASYQADISRKTKYILVWSKRVSEAFNKEKRSAYILGSPFVIYRNYRKIEKEENATGTVFYPQHSTKNVSAEYDIESLAHKLKNLPDTYMPITVCLHYVDFEEKKHLWDKYGFQIVTAGPSRQKGFDFVNNFYNILKNHKYSCSNDIGSYLFYSVEMGVPFFIIGDPPELKFRSSENKIQYAERNEIVSLFSKNDGTISKDQISYVSTELGLDEMICPNLLRKKLLFSYLSKFSKNK